MFVFARSSHQDSNHLVPGEWARWLWGADVPYTVTAVCACPACGHVGTLAPHIHSIAVSGVVSPSYVCPFKPCTFHQFVALAGWTG